jgi:hypothetical protein
MRNTIQEARRAFRPDLKDVSALSDADFRKYIQRGCQPEEDARLCLLHAIEYLEQIIEQLGERVAALERAQGRMTILPR